MRLLFPIFDALARRGLLSTEGTARDYFVVLLVSLVLASPILIAIVVLS